MTDTGESAALGPRKLVFDDDGFVLNCREDELAFRQGPRRPEPGDAFTYQNVDLVCDDVTDPKHSKRYRAYAAGGGALLCDSRCWEVVLCVAFAILPQTAAGRCNLRHWSASRYAKLKVWTDPESGEDLTVITGNIISAWTIVLCLEGGERVELNANGEVNRRYWMRSDTKWTPTTKAPPTPPPPMPAHHIHADPTPAPLKPRKVPSIDADGQAGLF